MTETLNRISRLCDALEGSLTQDASARSAVIAQIKTDAASLVDPVEISNYRDGILNWLAAEIAEQNRIGMEMEDPLEAARRYLYTQAYRVVADQIAGIGYPFKVSEKTAESLEYLERLAPERSFPQPFEVFYSNRSSGAQNRQVAEGVIFTNGTVAVSWINFNPHQRVYASMEEFRTFLEGNYSILYPARNGKLAEGLTSPLANVAYHAKKKAAEPTGPTPNIFAKRQTLQTAV